MPTVKCTVDNCHYWSAGKGCNASAILITTDEIGASQPDSIDASVVQTLNNTPAESCMETCCKTFLHQGSPKKHADDISLRS